MFVALDKDGKRVDIDDVILSKNTHEKYYCPCCGGELIIKNGSINISHFAHKTLNECDTFKSDMSEWHRTWQMQFPEEYREVIIEKDGIKHRADVCFADFVIEFQHSPISYEEFNERNWFYSEAGYKVIWIFDMIELFSSCKIECIDEKHDGFQHGGKYKWNYASKVFSDVSPQHNKDVMLFFQFFETNFNDEDNGYLERVTWAIFDPETGSNYKRFFTSYYPGNLNLLMKYLKSKSKEPNHLIYKNFNAKKYYSTIFTKMSSDFFEDFFEYDDSDWHNDYLKHVPFKNRNVEIAYSFPKNFEDRYEHEGGVMEVHKADIAINGYVIVPSSYFPNYYDFFSKNIFYEYSGYKTIWIFDIREYIKNNSIQLYYNDGIKNKYRCADIRNIMAELFRYYSIRNKSNKTIVLFQTKDADLGKDESYLEKLEWASYEKDSLVKNFEVFITSSRIKNLRHLLDMINLKPSIVKPLKG